MQSILVPVIKNKSGDSNDVNNYRPIALVTIASNIFETILLDVMEPFIVTCDNQFGFKKKTFNRTLYLRIEKCYFLLQFVRESSLYVFF